MRTYGKIPIQLKLWNFRMAPTKHLHIANVVRCGSESERAHRANVACFAKRAKSCVTKALFNQNRTAGSERMIKDKDLIRSRVGVKDVVLNVAWESRLFPLILLKG